MESPMVERKRLKGFEGFRVIPELLEAKRLADKLQEPVKVSDRSTDCPTDRLTDQVTDHSISQSVSQSPIRSVTQPVTDPISQSVSHSISQSPTIHLKGIKLKVYDYLLSIGLSGFVNIVSMRKQLNITEPSARRVMREMRALGVLTYQRYQNAGKQGITYRILTDKNIERPTTKNDQSLDQSVNQSLDQSVSQSVTPISSSSFLKETTTKGHPLDSDPDLSYWRDKGLTRKQVECWMEEFEMGEETILQSLRHCAYEMDQLGLETNKPVEDVFSWFYRRIERAGYYAPPNGYKTRTERQIEIEKQLLEKKRTQVEELQRIREEITRLEIEERFQEMMRDREGELYQRCYSMLNDIEKGVEKKNPPLFEEAMRGKFASLQR